MVVSFDKLPPGSAHVLGRKQAKRFAEAITPPEVLARITRLHFGCNRRTTQEARITGRGQSFTIRINFWTESSKSRVLSDEPSWINIVQSLGGIVNAGAAHVEWPEGSADRYAAFLLAHEIAHVVYWQKRDREQLPGRRGGTDEESWCDRWARDSVEANVRILASSG